MITGRLSTGKHVVQGWPARVIGVIGLSPVPLSFVAGIAVTALLLARGTPVTQQSFFWTGTLIEGSTVILCAMTMGILARVYRTPVETSSIRFIAPWPTILEAIDRTLGDLGAKSIKWSNDRHRVSAKIRASIWSRGEQLTVDADESGEVRVTSVCQFQLIDWGKNAQNCRKFLQSLAGHLEQSLGPNV